jgi:dolichol-phosphate mannosyltransferase
VRSLCIVPVFNQAKELPKLIELCKQGMACTDLLFVDDGSTDGSSAIMKNSGFKYVRTDLRRGVGHALILGTRYAYAHHFDIVVHMAGNGKMLPAEMHRILDPILENKADYVWGSRYLPGGRFVNAPAFRKYGIPLVMNKIPLVLTGKRLSDTTCGYRAYKLSVLDNIAPDWDASWLYGYEFEYYVLAKVLLKTERYREVPISMVYPPSKKNYSKIIPVISWWYMLKPWIVVRFGLEPKRKTENIKKAAA